MIGDKDFLSTTKDICGSELNNFVCDPTVKLTVYAAGQKSGAS